MNNNLNQNQNNKKKKVTHHQNFVEALKSVGSGVANSVKQDLIKGVGQGVADTVSSTFSANSENNPTQHSQQNPFENMTKPSWMVERENEIRAEEAAKRRHQEVVNAQPLFDRQQEQVKEQIKQLREELLKLAQEVGNVASSVQKAASEEIVSPGSYHVSFFEAMMRFVQNLRKQVKESKNWMQASAERKAAKNVYWGNVKKHGTKYMMSEERSKATQTG